MEKVVGRLGAMADQARERVVFDGERGSKGGGAERVTFLRVAKERSEVGRIRPTREVDVAETFAPGGAESADERRDDSPDWAWWCWRRSNEECSDNELAETKASGELEGTLWYDASDGDDPGPVLARRAAGEGDANDLSKSFA